MYPSLIDALRKRAAENRPVRVAVIGAGRFGTTVIAQMRQMPALRLAVVGDIRQKNAVSAWAASGADEASIVEGTTATQVADAVQAGRPVWTSDLTAAIQAPIDVVVEVTGIPEIAARTATTAIDAGRHIVMVTVEADTLFGSLLRRRAERASVVYTLTDGDQPAVTKRLVDWAQALGYRIAAAGRGTRFYATDWDGRPEEAFARYGYDPELTERRRFNPQMYNSFRDGSKAQIEMCALANVTGLVPDRRGMHEPSAGLADLPRRFALKEDGGLLNQLGVVDLANCVGPDGTDVKDGIAGGVWVVLYTEHPLLQEDLPFYGLPGAVHGKYAALYRPYHLCGIETPLSIAEAALLNIPTAQPLPTPVADVITIAKHDLKPGDKLGGSGDAHVRAAIERREVALADKLLPICITHGVNIKRPVATGAYLTWDDVEIPSDSLALRLRREQDGL